MVDEPRYRSERETVTDTGVDMVAQELTKGTGGNVSARTDDGNVVISPSGVPYDDIDPEEVPAVTVNGEQVAGDLSPSSETPMHTTVYAGRADIGGIVHPHSPYPSTFASLREPIPASSYLAYAGHEVPVAGYAPPGSEELANDALDALGEATNACLLANHDMLAIGDSVKKAFENALIVEHCARIHYQASAIGDPVVLSDREVDDLIAGFDDYRNQ